MELIITLEKGGPHRVVQPLLRDQVCAQVNTAAHIVYGPHNQDRYEHDGPGTMVQTQFAYAESIIQTRVRLGTKAEVRGHSRLVATGLHTWKSDTTNKELDDPTDDEIMSKMVVTILQSAALLTEELDTIYINREGNEHGGYTEGPLEEDLRANLMKLLQHEIKDPAPNWSLLEDLRQDLHATLNPSS